jgi:hypothetical protein
MAYSLQVKEQAQSLRNEGCSYRQIAGQLGVSAKAVNCWLNTVVDETQRQCNTKWRKAHPERKKNWYRQNKQHCQHYQAERQAHRNKLELCRKQSPQYRLACNLRSRLNTALGRKTKLGSAVRDLGCSIAFLKQHLEFQFHKGMTWENYGQWHIDHKRPLASFDLTNCEQFLEACHYTNLQPLWAVENLSKGTKRG